MFLVYINELAAILVCYGIKIKLFADNAKLYVQIVNELNVVQLQQAIDVWSWQVCRLHPLPTPFTSTLPPFPYLSNNTADNLEIPPDLW